MTCILAEVPNVNYKSGFMLGSWSWSVWFRVAIWLTSLCVYVYLLFVLKTLFLKDERLDHIDNGIKDTQQLLDVVKSLDLQLQADLEHLEAARGY